MNDETSRDPASAKLAGSLVWLAAASALHLLLWLVVLLFFYLYVPWQKEVFADFGVELPQATILVIQLSDLTVMYWYLLVPMAFIAVIGVNAAIMALVRSPRWRLGLAVMLAIPPVIWVLGCYLVIRTPLNRLMQELQ